MAICDLIFKRMCTDILETGYETPCRAKWEDGSIAHTIKKFGIVNKYNLQEEFPALTLRPINFKNCIDELLWIWVKQSNNIKDLNSKIWDAWADDNGSIGKAYGYQLNKEYKFKDIGYMNQVDRVLYLLKNNKNDRRMIVNMFNHEDLIDMGLEPCAYSITLNVTKNRLNMILNQRSQDILVAGNWNVVQYAVLLHMFAHISNLQVGELVHVIADAHIYDKHIPIVRELISKQPFAPANFKIVGIVNNFYDFTLDNFEFSYDLVNKFNKKIPVAV